MGQKKEWYAFVCRYGKKDMTYKVTLTMMGKKYNATGDSVADAVSKIKPNNVKAKGILTIEHGENKREKILMPHIAHRLFNSVGLNREVAMKNITILFSGV